MAATPTLYEPNAKDVMPPAADSDTPFLRLTGVHKRYGGVTALDGVDLTCRRGSIHAVLGENGAGKSTLVKCAMGYYAADEGQILLNGREVAITH